MDKRRKITDGVVSAAFAIFAAALALTVNPGRASSVEAGEVLLEATSADLARELTAEISTAESTPETETAEEPSAESTAAAEIQPIAVTNILHGVHLWTGFSACESDGENGRSAGSDGGHAYGIFQFDDRCDLDWFLRQCVAANPVKYAAFRPFVEAASEAEAEDDIAARKNPETESTETEAGNHQETGSGKAAVGTKQEADRAESESRENQAAGISASESSSDAADASEESLEEKIAEKAATEAELPASETASLINAWHKVYDADPEGFTNMQLSCFAKLYYPACVRQCAERGIDLNSSAYSPVLRGTLWSICIWAGSGGLQKIVDKLTPAMTEQEMLDACYTEDTASLKTKSYKTRWTVRQPELARKALERWSAGQSIPEYVGP